MLTCKELTEVITDYLEGRMSFGQRLRFRMHLALCRSCRRYLRQMRLTIQALRRTLSELPAERMPAEMRDELCARLRSLRPRESD
ncbi:MAG: zf-HC2 domain-containing protein [Proteobacteria bacterium]|nr:zf-HC2 domain-containing protein [Pseudomonadota bacterium]